MDKNTLFTISASGSIGLAAGIMSGIIFKNKFRNLFGSLGLINKSAFSGLNLPTAGARNQKALRKGNNPIQLHSLATPNGQKVTILLEELGLDYDAYVVDISKGDQFSSGFVDINPNSKIPSAIDYTDNKEKGVRLFESGSILLHFAEKTGKFIPSDPVLRTECINMLFFQVGSAPLMGQFGHFTKFCPTGFWFDHSYSYDRYKMETQRLLSVLDNILSERTYLIGEEYTIADMAWWPWVNGLDQGYNVWETLEVDTKYVHVVRWANIIKQRPAAQKGIKINSWKEDGVLDYSSK